MYSSLRYVAAEIGVTVEDLTGGLSAAGCCRLARGGTRLRRCGSRAHSDDPGHFHRDLAIDDEAMPVVLDLLDRLYAARANCAPCFRGSPSCPSRRRASFCEE